MKKEDFINLGIDEELANKLEQASIEELKSFIPKGRFDEINNSKKSIETQIAELQKNTGNAEELKAQIAQLQKDIEEKNAQIEQMALDAVVDEVLNSYKVRNKTAVKALLKDLVLYENGDVKRLTKQLDSLKESDGYLFDVDGYCVMNPNIETKLTGELLYIKGKPAQDRN